MKYALLPHKMVANLHLGPIGAHMGILIIFAAGVSVGLAADKLYHTFVTNKKEDYTDQLNTSSDSKDDAANQEVAATDEREPQQEDCENDLSQLKGVGPRLGDAFNNIGITSYAQLSSASVDSLFERLKETGGRFTRPVISSVIEQAKQAMRATTSIKEA